MNKNHIYLLLNIIKHNGNLKRLHREGLSFLAIANLTTKLIEEKLIQYNDLDYIELSKKGLSKLKELETTLKVTNKNLWIDKELSSKISKIDPNFIFLPHRDELYFD